MRSNSEVCYEGTRKVTNALWKLLVSASVWLGFDTFLLLVSTADTLSEC